LNVPVLFDTTENAFYNQFFAALIIYVLLKWLYKQTKPPISSPTLSPTAFQRMVLTDTLPLEWLAQMSVFLHDYFARYREVCLILANQHTW
jgi:IS4 transposase